MNPDWMTNREGVNAMSDQIETVETEETTPTVNTDGILASMQLMLGMEPEYRAFNTDLIIHINTILGKLNQIGVGVAGYQLDLTDPYTSKWEDFLGESNPTLNMAKTYTYLNLRVLFDPPSNSFVLDSIRKEIDEYTWRLRVEADEWPGNHE